MNKLSRVVGIAVLFASLTPVEGHATEDCAEVQARGDGGTLPDGTTAATIQNGILRGTTHGVFGITGLQGNTLLFAGTLTFDTKHGTLETQVVGTLDLTSGAFTTDTVAFTSGSGNFAGATGTISVTGVQNLVTGTFTETLRGQVCLPE